jgi:cytochrome c peroxidase
MTVNGMKQLYKISRFPVFFFSGVVSILLLTQCHNDNKQAELLELPAEHDICLTPPQMLGKKLFFDTNLSNPPGQSCATCHMPSQGFADPEMLAVSRGATKSIFGHRNTTTVSYSSYTPYFHYDSTDEVFVGGLFWDGRAATLSEQAMNPLLSHEEMNNMDKKSVVEQVKKSDYKDLFIYVFGKDAFNDPDKAFRYIAEVIEEYEETRELSPFTSKFDYYTKGLAKFSPSEKRGMALFNNPKKGNCAACHPSTPDQFCNTILFTDYTYDNLGVPVNQDLVKLDVSYKRDLGLGSRLKKDSENGKFKVPTLRNVAMTAPYFHNGVFKTLEEVMDFYNDRNSGRFGKAEVEENVNHEELGDLKLNKQEIQDIVAFLKTLTDGYKVKTY